MPQNEDILENMKAEGQIVIANFFGLLGDLMEGIDRDFFRLGRFATIATVPPPNGKAWPRK